MVSLASLLGLLLLPVAKSPRLEQYYQYTYALLISLGASALFCDAVLHLIPEVCAYVYVQMYVCMYVVIIRHLVSMPTMRLPLQQQLMMATPTLLTR